MDPSTAPPHHQLSVRGCVGVLQINVDLSMHAPWTVLFGPSGCGKSTLLRALCGLTPGLTVTARRGTSPGPTTLLEGPGQRLAPERRDLAFSPQQAVLFPHLTVRGNIDFATSVRSSGASETSLSAQALHFFGLEALAERLPRALSGGERQRVSLARALAVPEARLLLLDEPFAGVDRTLRDDLIPRLRSWCAERSLPVLSVTHDVDEVFLLGAEVVRLREGHVIAQGPPATVLADEAERVRRALSLPSQHPTGEFCANHLEQ